MSASAIRDDPAAIAVEDRMFGALAVLRTVLLVNAVALYVWRRASVDHPGWGAAVMVAIAAWTAVAIWAYRSPERRRAPLLVADLSLTVATILASVPIKGDDLRATIAGFWVMGAMLAWAVRWGWRGGLVASVCVTAADLAIRSEFTQTNYGNQFLLMIGGPIVGYLCESLKRMAVERDRAERSAAASAERARLARAVHDGVLQVLTLVQRRGAELGGEFAGLGRMAGEQEHRLRSLIRQQDSVSESAGAETMDLAAELARLEADPPPAVSVATPGTPVELDQERGRQAVAAVRACLDNVAGHVGPDARAWVLVEELGDVVVISVRDEGPGIAPDRLESAAAEGRLGVSESIRGRVADLGGTARLTTGSHGTEWELTIPR